MAVDQIDQINQRLECILPHVKSFDIAVDCGAHHGVYAREIARHFKRVYCFEPIPDNFKILVENKTDNMIPHNYAVSNRNRKVKLVNKKQKSVSWNIQEDSKLPHIVARAIYLDNAIHGNVGFLKIDVEGHEREVVLGAMTIITKYRPVIMVEECFVQVDDMLTPMGYREIARFKHDRIYICP
ncbi:MAG: FkbM family methyltransferase [Candidatus Paceibacterota bacterium]|jgi:FkbM family methyltransferase